MWELEDGDELIDTCRVPDGARLRLVRNGGDFVILLDRNELMSTDVCASEVQLAEMTCARLAGRSNLQMLIGGYGLGFTLRAALEVLDDTAHVTVAEIVPEIVQWARGPMAGLTAGCLDDRRVQLVHDDVAMLIDAARDAYDAILLDVDNGPEGLTRALNGWLYSRDGLQAAARALRPGGILAVWSAFQDPAFVALLGEAGFTVEVASVDAGEEPQAGRDPLHHVIFFATKA
ncbi:spermidine synthase [Novosphingobium jiangmenense]|uniref:Spermidine synthase n=1 Tax=Novosphingobium jiangmenense TaxID=2791981 RepID=A0ABS0HJS7_9SPHN|nr:spermidine synthase [Novosphingobium jiangmenense]MBF9152498.1 spermidine synthase [Novosphingobium jiangmenense]